jgi:predicted dehydrogenase
MLKSPLTGVDTNTSFTLNFPDAQAILTTSININDAPSLGCNVRYEHGTITISPPLYCPKQFTVDYHDKDGKTIRQETRMTDYVGKGLHFQADEVARCIRDGKKESEIWSHQKMVLVMEVFDEVRRQGGYVFPPGVEKVSV